MKVTKAVRVAEKAEYEAREKYRKAKRTYEAELNVLDHEAHERNVESLAHMAEVVGQLRACATVAEQVLQSERIREANESDEGYPVGTVVVEWSTPLGYGWSHKREPLKLTGRRGTIEVWTPESPAPANTRWSQPSVGQKYVRLFKKDGTVSLKFDSLTGWHGQWFREGEKPTERSWYGRAL